MVERVKLKEICRLINGRAYKQDELLDSGKYPVLRVGNFFSDKDFYYSDLELEDDKYCDNGDLLFAWSASFGPKVWNGGKVIYHYHIWKMELTERVERDYLYFYLFHLSERIKSEGHGGIMIHTTKAEMEEREFLLPELQEQRNIVKLLSKISTVIAARKDELQKLDELVKARFVEMFGDPFDTAKWPVCELKDISESLIDGSNIDPNYYESEGEVLFLRIQNVWRNEFRLDDSVYVSKKVNHEYYDTSLRTGDLLITKIGRYYTKDSSLGRVAVYRGLSDGANYSNNIMRVRLNASMNSEYVNTLLNLDDYQKYIRQTSKGGTDKRALSKSLIGSYPIIVPPKSVQDDFATFVKQIDKSKVVVQEALDKAQLLFDSLMHKYFVLV